MKEKRGGKVSAIRQVRPRATGSKTEFVTVRITAEEKLSIYKRLGRSERISDLVRRHLFETGSTAISNDRSATTLSGERAPATK